MNVRAMRAFVFLAAGAAAMANEGDFDSNIMQLAAQGQSQLELLGLANSSSVHETGHGRIQPGKTSGKNASSGENLVEPLRIGAEGLRAASGAAGALHGVAPVFGTPIELGPDLRTVCGRMSVGDLDGDGLADIFPGCSNRLAWYRNLGGGNFAEATVINTEGYFAEVSVADVDNDGLADVIQGSHGKISWFRNLGGGALDAEAVVYTDTSTYHRLVAIDFDNDGLVDILRTCYWNHRVTWLKNMGSGNFAATVLNSAGQKPRSVFATDLDGDGYTDILLAYNTDGLSWYRNTGASSFEAESVIANSGWYFVSAGDLDNDGNIDILVGSYYDSKVAWFRNLGGGSFSAEAVIDSDCVGVVVKTVDMDHDGNLDVVASCRRQGVFWYRNLGNGSFAPASMIWAGAGVLGFVVADLDNDGDFDLAASEYDGKKSWVSINSATTPPTPSPTLVQAAAVGDPHLQNMFGERFDLAKPGKSILVSIPRGTPVEDALLVVQADARQLGARCSDMYFQEINITGKWTKADLRYTAQVVNDETPQWSKFGPVELKVAHGHTEKGVTYLNLYVRHLGLAGAAVGGLLGEDDHTEAAAPSAACRKTMSLAKHATRSTSELQDASVAFAAAL